MKREYLGFNSDIRLANENSIIKEIKCGLDYSLALNYKGEVYSWGANTKGYLGLGNYNDQYKLNQVEFPKESSDSLNYKKP